MTIRPRLRGELLRGFRTLFLAYLNEEEHDRRQAETTLRAELERLDVLGPNSDAAVRRAEEYKPGDGERELS